MVLHDLNLAARYSDHIVAMKDGEIVACGSPSEVLDADVVCRVFGVSSHIAPDPRTGRPLVVATGQATPAPAVHPQPPSCRSQHLGPAMPGRG